MADKIKYVGSNRLKDIAENTQYEINRVLSNKNVYVADDDAFLLSTDEILTEEVTRSSYSSIDLSAKRTNYISQYSYTETDKIYYVIVKDSTTNQTITIYDEGEPIDHVIASREVCQVNIKRGETFVYALDFNGISGTAKISLVKSKLVFVPKSKCDSFTESASGDNSMSFDTRAEYEEALEQGLIPIGTIVYIDDDIGGETKIVTSWETTPSDNKVPSEKLVKESLDSKASTDVATTSANGLMSSTDKTKLNGIESGATKTTIDTSLSTTSTNPVQNWVVNNALYQNEQASNTKLYSMVGTSNAYTDEFAYEYGNYVIHNNCLYMCIVDDNQGVAPPNTNYWKKVSLTELNSNLNLLRYPSTTERVVGEYNGKTIYETTFTGDMSSTSTGGSAYFKKITTLGTSAVLMSVSGSVKRSDGNNITLGTYLTDTSRAFVNLTGSGDLRVTVGNDYNGSNVTYIATVRYTK